MGKFIDLTGQKFGKLTVIKRTPNKNNRTMWLCECECGNEVEVRSDQLRGEVAQSCGCLRLEHTKKMGHNNFKDLTNQKFGKLTALKPIFNEKSHKYDWFCQCDCGNTTIARGTALTSGNTRSCGCIKSIGESNIEKILKENNINYIPQYRITIDNKVYIYDFAILENNIITKFIEFDGIQHYGRISGWFTEERRKQLQVSDSIKNQYAKEQHISLIRIPYWERDSITLDLIFNKNYELFSNMEEAQEEDLSEDGMVQI